MPFAPGSWWREGVLYQIYPRSFADSDGDGTGDLRGVIARLDHLEWLGVAGIWLNPVMPSPNADWGYDVADYCAVRPDLGTLEDVDELVRAAGARGIRVLFDLVPNHTSEQHPWFEDSRSGREARHRDWYVWADPRPDGGPPNNWLAAFGGPAWTLDEATGQYYLHNFTPRQPDLNWWSAEVRDAFDRILRFWFERGIAGFRIDVAHAIVKDRLLRDNPPLTPDDHPEVRRMGQRQTYSMNRPEVHDVLRRWRALADAEEEPRILIGETYVLTLDELAAFYGGGADELNLAFNFPFVFSPLSAAPMREVVEGVESRLPQEAWPVWTGSNHDVGRLATRWAQGDERRTRCALMVLLTLRGTPFLYYGDEIGLESVDVPADEARDVAGRDHCRTPMPWSAAPGAGFTAPDARPWLPIGDPAARNVEAQRGDPASVLNMVRDLIALRRRRVELRTGAYESLPAPDGVWAWRRGHGVTVAVNLSGRPAAVPELSGTVEISTDRTREGAAVEGELELEPWQAAVLVA